MWRISDMWRILDFLFYMIFYHFVCINNVYPNSFQYVVRSDGIISYCIILLCVDNIYPNSFQHIVRSYGVISYFIIFVVYRQCVSQQFPFILSDHMVTCHTLSFLLCIVNVYLNSSLLYCQIIWYYHTVSFCCV